MRSASSFEIKPSLAPTSKTVFNLAGTSLIKSAIRFRSTSLPRNSSSSLFRNSVSSIHDSYLKFFIGGANSLRILRESHYIHYIRELSNFLRGARVRPQTHH